jgi:hypothetical protein
MRKWDEPPSPSAAPADATPETDTVRHRARAFRRWLARGAEPGGLRALAEQPPRGADPRARTDAPRGAQSRP